jgi:hypothetical protein
VAKKNLYQKIRKYIRSGVRLQRFLFKRIRRALRGARHQRRIRTPLFAGYRTFRLPPPALRSCRRHLLAYRKRRILRLRVLLRKRKYALNKYRALHLVTPV